MEFGGRACVKPWFRIGKIKAFAAGSPYASCKFFFSYRETKHCIGDTLTCVKQWTRFRAACSYPKARQLEAMSAFMGHQELLLLGRNQKSKQLARFRAIWYFFGHARAADTALSTCY